MATIVELVTRYKQGELTFDAVLAEVPALTWGQRHKEDDGEIWWEGPNNVIDVEVLWFEDIITEEERTAILSRIP
jgi:hypothetical protein